MRLDSIPAQLIGVTEYSADTSQVTYDVAYDLWLHEDGHQAAVPDSGTLEIMVWTGYDARALLPPSLQVGAGRHPLAVDGVRPPGHAGVVRLRQQHRPGRPDGPWGGSLWFVPARLT